MTGERLRNQHEGRTLQVVCVRYEDDGTMHFPEILGMCEILHDRGFILDHRRERGNVH